MYQWPDSADSIGEPGRGTSFRFCRFFFSILRRSVRFERMNETSRDLGYFVDSSQERSLIRFRRFTETADFSHELERGILDLFGGNRRIKVEQCLDVPAHSCDLNETRLNPLYCPVYGRQVVCRSFARGRY